MYKGRIEMDDPLFSVNKKVIVLTGACGLIGSTLTEELSRRKACMVIADGDERRLTEISEQIAGHILGVLCDVANADSVKNLVNRTLSKFGHVDVLINCHQYKPKGFLEAQAESFPDELWDAVINVNLKGTFLTCREFGRVMLDQGKGSIINFASTYGIVSSNPALYQGNCLGNPVAYSASKGGVIMLTRYLGAHWARRGVRVNCITPHGVYNGHETAFTEHFNQMSPIGRMMRVEEVVAAAIFLATDASSYAVASNLQIDGGWTAW
jgi:NAD(P)-dependent dehydrogenase (short-subunit alcohol dehydrogenase family)